MTFTTKSLTTARECLRVSRKNSPAERGVHVGEGIHVPMPEEWDGESDEVPIGWSGIPLEELPETQELKVYIEEIERVKGEDLTLLRQFKALASTELDESPIKEVPVKLPVKR